MHIQSPSIVTAVYSSIFKISRRIQGFRCIFSHTKSVQLWWEKGDLPCHFWKSRKMSLCFLLVFLRKCLWKYPSSTNPFPSLPLPWKISGCPPAIRHYSCKTLHLKHFSKFDNVLNTSPSWQLLSNLYSGLMIYTASDTFRILAYSAL